MNENSVEGDVNKYRQRFLIDGNLSAFIIITRTHHRK